MSQYLEFQGKNVDSALKEAGERLNKPVEKIRYEVVSYGSSGIFGLVGAKKAKIRIKSEDAFGVDQDTKAQARDLVKDAFEIQDEPDSKNNRKEADPPKENNKKEPNRTRRPDPSPEGVKEAATIGKEALQRFVDFITNDAVIDVSATPQRIILRLRAKTAAC